MRQVGKAGKRRKGRKAVEKAATDQQALEAMIDARVAQLTKSHEGTVRSLTKKLNKRNRDIKELLRQPDPTRRAQAGTSTKQFKPAAPPVEDLEGREKRDRVKVLKGRMKDPNSETARLANEALMRMLTPEEYARIAVEDDD